MGFPWDAGRDDGYANVGLIKLIRKQADEGMWLRARAAMKLINKNPKAFEEAIVRRLVSPANMGVSGGQVDLFPFFSTGIK
ncbi:hypothetical protein ACISK3_01515 [Morganella morganii]